MLNGIAFKQQFNECNFIERIHWKSQTNRDQNRTHYFYNDIINTEELNSSLLKIDKKSYKDIGIYYNGYIKNKKIDDCDNIYSVNPLYMIIGKVNGHNECNSFECEKNGVKFSFWFYRWKQRSIKKLRRTLGWDQKWNWNTK